jgi:hypothetical protein
MHYDAELAMIRVGRVGVDVCHLYQRQQSQQDHAQSRGGYDKCAPPVMGADWLESVQKVVTPYFQDTQNWMLPCEERLHDALNRAVASLAAYLLDTHSSKM